MRRRIVSILAVSAVAVLVAGCADSGFQYVKSSEDKTYFKVPDHWTLYDERELVEATDATEREREIILEDSWQVGFDADPKPSLGHVSEAVDHPAGLALVRQLTADESDIVSTSALRNLFYEVDTALEEGTLDVRDYEDLTLDGGFRGIHLVVDIDVDGKRVTVDQTTLLDQATTRLYVLLVSCTVACYERNEDDIRSVVDSWTVRKR